VVVYSGGGGGGGGGEWWSLVVVVVVKPRRDVTESTANHPDDSHYTRVVLELWCVPGARHEWRLSCGVRRAQGTSGA
jgi:hypothetical protein